MIRLNTCLNKPTKIYGLPRGGVLTAVSFLLIGIIIHSLVVGAIMAVIGMGLGTKLSQMWFKGQIQRLMYWYLPIARIFGKNCPPSSKRFFK